MDIAGATMLEFIRYHLLEAEYDPALHPHRKRQLRSGRLRRSRQQLLVPKYSGVGKSTAEGGRECGDEADQDKALQRSEASEKGGRVWLGIFNTAEEAALAYDRAAFRIPGTRGIVNFPLAVGSNSETGNGVSYKRKRRCGGVGHCSEEVRACGRVEIQFHEKNK